MSAEIRTLTPAEVAELLDWAGAEGWNPGPGDAAAFHAADPEGFLGCFVDGTMAAGIAAVAYDAGYGFIGLYICRPEHRGNGFGRAVWDAGMARLGGRTIGLDGVPEQQANYRSMGFRAAYETLRFTGRPDPETVPADAGWSVERYRPEMLDAVLGLDRACFPADRARFMRAWLEAPREAVVATRGGVLGGFGVVRRCLAGHKIGPLLALEDGAASAILPALAQRVGGEISIDVPEHRGAFRRVLAASGMAPGFRTARMYRGPAPVPARDGTYGVTSLELG